jgi:hypothetical protein
VDVVVDPVTTVVGGLEVDVLVDVVVGRLVEVDVVVGTVDVVVPLALIVTIAVSLAADQAPALSCTQSVAVNVPVVAKTWLTVTRFVVSDPPSLNCHQYEMMVPSGSDDPAPLKLTATFTVPVRSGPAFAIGF